MSIRRFQGHSAFVISSFDISRLNHNSSKTNVLTRRKIWPTTALLLDSLTAEQLMEGARAKVKGDAILSVIRGSPLLVMDNIDIDLGLVNGAIVEFYGFADNDGALIHDEIITTPPVYMLIRLKDDVGVDIAIPGLPPSVVDVEPVKST